MFVLNKIRLRKFPWNKTGSLRSILIFLENQEGSLDGCTSMIDCCLLGQFHPLLSLFCVSLFFLRYLWYASAQSLATFVLLLRSLSLLGVMQRSHNIFDVKIRGPRLLHFCVVTWGNLECFSNQFFRYLARQWKACISKHIPKSKNVWKCISENLEKKINCTLQV